MGACSIVHSGNFIKVHELSPHARRRGGNLSIIPAVIILVFILSLLKLHPLLIYGIILLIAGIIYYQNKFLKWWITYFNSIRGIKTDTEIIEQRAVPIQRLFALIMIIIGLFLSFLGFYASVNGIK